MKIASKLFSTFQVKKIKLLVSAFLFVTFSLQSSGQYVPPVGIPAPSFGINETHEMYAGQYYAAGEFDYLDAGNGPYSHYVDNTDPQATDTNNPYGTKDKPRLTIPSFVSAGSVVEIHGGPYTHKLGSHLRLDGAGTAELPIFFRGTGIDSLAQIGISAQTGFKNSAQYIILENLRMHSYSMNPADGNTISHICLRNSEVSGNTSSGGVSVASWITGNYISNIVLYNLDIHDNGLWDVTPEEDKDQDVHGVGIGAYVDNMWILDSKLYHNSGNGIQLTGGGPSGDNMRAHHIYMGRNYDNGEPNLQCFIGIKGSSDVIVSENHVSTQGGIRTSVAMQFQYGPERVWFLFNKIHDVNGGIGAGSNSVSNPGQESYFIGNLIYNIYQKDYSEWNPANSWSNAAMKLWGGVNRYVIGNTMYNVDAGIYTPSAGTFNIINNIISEVTQPTAQHIFVESKNNTSGSVFYNNLFSQETEEGDVRIKWGDLAGDVAAFEAGTTNALDNIDADPLFTNTATDDLFLQANSPAVDAGISEGIVKDVFDRFEELYGMEIRHITIDADTRPNGEAWDIGAYEYVDNVSVTGVSVSPTSLTLEEGETSELSETVSPANATDNSVTWSSSNALVATVSSSGLVTAVSAGSATITVTTNDGSFTADCSVSVNASVSASSLTFDNKEIKLYPNPTLDRSFTIDLSDYSSQDEFNISILDVTGKVSYSNSIVGGQLHRINDLQSSTIYFVKVQSEEINFVEKLLVK